MVNIEIIDKLNKNKTLDECEWEKLISDYTKEDYEYSSSIAREIAKEKFSNKLYLRGIVEFSNICKVSTKTLRYYAEIGLILQMKLTTKMVIDIIL